MVAVIAALSVMVVDGAEAKRGMSVGSRGTRTYQAPPSTNTAPSAAPIQRSTTPQTTPSASAAQAPRRSFFGSGLAGGLMRGLLIGGLIGLLMGHGLGGLAGLFGLLLQGALLALVVMLALRFFRRRQPVPAGMASRNAAQGEAPSAPRGAGGLGSAIPGLGSRAAPASSSPFGPADAVGITPADLDAFERLLGEIQTALGREDEAALRERVTGEVFDFLGEEVRQNMARGVRNEVSEVKLLQGDLAEAWREGPREYATVAMRFSSRDVVVDRASGRFISGDRDRPGESTEVWTFVRELGGPWRLSAIQGASPR